MEVWLLVIGIVVLCIGYPYVRCFFKRLSLRSKVKKKCRDKGYSLQGTHRFWFFGGKYGKKYDCYIETEEELFAIKLFGMSRHKRVLFFTENNEFFIRRYFQFHGWKGGFFKEVFDSKPEALPKYDFDYKCKQEANGKLLRKLLLVNPVPMDIRMKPERQEEFIINVGDTVNDMELMNLSGLLKEL